MRRAALLVGRVGAVISDQRISHGHDLAAIGRIGQHFLVTGHRGVEADFADPRAGGAKRFALENPAVFEGKKARIGRQRLSSLIGRFSKSMSAL